MSQQQTAGIAGFTLDASKLANSAITWVRVALGLLGAAALVIGVLMVFAPAKTAVALAWLLGIYWIIAGIGYVAVGALAKGMTVGARVLDIVLGVLMVVAGITVVSSPTETAIILGLFLGIYIGVLWVVEGIVTLLQSGDAPSRLWAIVFGVISIVAGVALFSSPWWGIQVLFLWTGIGLIVLGIVQLVRAFQFGRGLVPAAPPAHARP